MTIGDKLYSIFSGSPYPVPAIGNKVFAVAAGQPTLTPYVVYTLLGALPIITQENNRTTRRWRYQFCTVGDTAEQAASVMESVLVFLIGYTDRPHPGIQRIIEVGGRENWLDVERRYERYADIDIMENLP